MEDYQDATSKLSWDLVINYDPKVTKETKLEAIFYITNS